MKGETELFVMYCRKCNKAITTRHKQTTLCTWCHLAEDPEWGEL